MTGTPWTCPDLDRIERIVRRHVPEPDLSVVLLSVGRLRGWHIALRAAADGREPHGLPAVLREVERRLARYDALAEASAGEAVPDLGEHPDGLVPAAGLAASTWPPPEPTPVPPEEP